MVHFDGALESDAGAGWRVDVGPNAALVVPAAGGVAAVGVGEVMEGGERELSGRESSSEEDYLSKWTEMNKVSVELARARQQVEHQEKERARQRLLDALSHAQRHALANESLGGCDCGERQRDRETER